MKKTLVYINPMCYSQMDMTILRYLTKEYNVIWYPIYKAEESKRFTESELQNYAKEYGIELHIYVKSIRDRSLKNFAYFKDLLEDVKRHHPDILYTCNEHYAFIWNLFRMFNKNIIVFGFHDVEGHSGISFRFIYKKIKEYAIRNSCNIVTFSKGQQQILLRKYHKESTMINLSSHFYGFSTKLLPPMNQGIRLLFVGGINSYKGLDLLISAMEELYEENIRNIRLSIYGNGKEEWSHCEPLIKHKDLYNTNIRFFENSELPDLLATHHFVVLPYRDVTNSGPLMIAVAYAKPIIAPTIGCFSEVYDSTQGILYEQGNLKEALRKVSSLDVDTYNSMCENCKILQEEYSGENIAKRYLKMFAGIRKTGL